MKGTPIWGVPRGFVSNDVANVISFQLAAWEKSSFSLDSALAFVKDQLSRKAYMGLGPPMAPGGREQRRKMERDARPFGASPEKRRTLISFQLAAWGKVIVLFGYRPGFRQLSRKVYGAWPPRAPGGTEERGKGK